MRDRDLLTFMFREPGWLSRLLVGAYLPLSIVGALAVSGYLAEGQRLALEGKLPRLPAWGRWADRSIMGAMLLTTDLIYLMLPGVLAGGAVLCLSIMAGGLASPLQGGHRVGAWLIWPVIAAWAVYLLLYLLLNLGPLPKAMWILETRLEAALTPGWVWQLARRHARALWPARRVTLLAYGLVVAVALLGLGLEALMRNLDPRLATPAIGLAVAVWAPVWFWARLVAMRAYAQAIERLGWEKLMRWG